MVASWIPEMDVAATVMQHALTLEPTLVYVCARLATHPWQIARLS